MKRTICVLVVSVMLISVLCGCDTLSKTARIIPQNTEQEQTPAVVEYSDTLKIALNHAKSLNPYDEQDKANLQALRLIYEPLFDYDENMRIVPVLAESRTLSDDGKTITVRLKDGVKFHDGKTLTANDVLDTFNWILSGETAYSKGEISRADVLDKRTVMISFFEKQMCPEEKLMFPIVKKNDAGYVGTGAYKYDGKDSTDVFAFSKNMEYHGEMPVISYVKMINTPGIDAVVRLFDIGETDILTSDAFDYASFKAGSEMSVYDYPVNSMVYMGINFNNSIFWGSNTRQALLSITDKEEIVEKAVYQKAVAADFPINPSSWLYPKEYEYTKDHTKAEELLLADSWKRIDGVYARMIDGKRQDFKISMLICEDEEMERIAQLLQKSFDNFGIRCTVVKKPYEEFVISLQNKEYDVFLDRTELSGSADFENLTGEGNVFGYKNSGIDALTEQIRTERDDALLKQKYNECCSIFLKDVQFIPIFFDKDAVVTGKNISKNVVPALYNPFYNMAQWNA